MKLSAKTGSFDMNYNCSVIKVEPNRELQWKWHIVLPVFFRGDHTFTIEPAGDNSVSFKNVEIFKGVLVPLFTKVISTDGKQGMLAMDQALKDRVEQSSITA